MSRYLLEKSKVDQGWYVLTDLRNLVVIKFKDGEFIETKNAACLGDKIEPEKMKEILSDAESYMALFKPMEGLSENCGLAFPENFNFSNSSSEENELIFYCKAPIKIKVTVCAKDFSSYENMMKSLENISKYLKSKRNLKKLT